MTSKLFYLKAYFVVVVVVVVVVVLLFWCVWTRVRGCSFFFNFFWFRFLLFLFLLVCLLWCGIYFFYIFYIH